MKYLQLKLGEGEMHCIIDSASTNVLNLSMAGKLKAQNKRIFLETMLSMEQCILDTNAGNQLS
jgi:hypothetical protein